MNKNFEEDIKKSIKKWKGEIEKIEKDHKYGVRNMYYISVWLSIPIHLIGVYLQFWDLSFLLFIGVFLYFGMLNFYENLLMRVEINTLDLQILMTNQNYSILKKIDLSKEKE